MDVYEAMERRRSIRRFKGLPTEDQLGRILAAGSLAPSPMNRQDWDVVVADDPELVARIAQVKFQSTMAVAGPGRAAEALAQRQLDSFANSAVLLVYHGTTIGSAVRFAAGAAWLLAENVCLAAAAEGLGSRIAAFVGSAEEEVGRLVAASPDKRLVCGINIGIPDDIPAPRALRPQYQWIHKNRFGV